VLNGTKLAFRNDGYHRWRLFDTTGGQLVLRQVYDDYNKLVNREVMSVEYDGNFGFGGRPFENVRLRVHKEDSTTNPIKAMSVKADNALSGPLVGIEGEANCTAVGGSGESIGIYGEATSDGATRTGVYCMGQTRSDPYHTGTSFGLYGDARRGQWAYGVFGTAGEASTNYAGYFSGNARVTGTLSKGAGSFIIDHPLDPEHKYLQHSFVESPDMMNVYNGNVVTDAGGYAEVELPSYFEALNRDFRYQLTVIGQFAQAIVAEKIVDNRFRIRTDKPNVEVSWQVTGIRKDPYAEANRIQVETDKPAEEQGKYLHHEAYGQPVERSVDYRNLKSSIDRRASRSVEEKQ
jgi:hypothetical protein